MSAPAGLALFDLDGTLVDSAPDIADAVDIALIACGRAPIGEAVVRGLIGNGAVRLIHRALTGSQDGEAEAGLHAQAYQHFVDAYQPRVFSRTRLFPGVVEVLAGLAQAGWALGCVTNKPARFTTPLLAAAGIAPCFALTLSGDSLPTKKPDAAPILHAATVLGVALPEVVMVGDSLTDLRAAQNARVRAVCVSFGYHAGVDLAAEGADAVIDDMRELLPLLGLSL
jgi:phosphoglycolate phosphatase